MDRAIEWDEEAKEVLRVSLEHSLAFGDRYIGTQHLLVAMVALRPQGVLGYSLKRDDVVDAIEATIGFSGSDCVLMGPDGCQTPRAKLALNTAAEIASQNARPVGLEDIWRGLLADPESQCHKVLRRLGGDAPSCESDKLG